MIKVEPDTDLEYLRKYFKLEIVSEQEDGFVVVASEEIDMATFLQVVDGFAEERRGATTAAKIYAVFGPENLQLRLERLLSDSLIDKWHEITDTNIYTVDVGIECLGNILVPPPPEQRPNETEAHFNHRLTVWRALALQAEASWDDLMAEREQGLISFTLGYGGEVLDILHDDHLGAATLPDSFTVRIRICGMGLRDLVINYPYLFEVNEPDEIDRIVAHPREQVAPPFGLEIQKPDAGSPAVCVIDSGIQEQHPLIAAAIEESLSQCFVPGVALTDVADYVSPGGHGTRVAGAVIYPREVPVTGVFKIPCWIQNARVLDKDNRLPVMLYPPLYLRAIVTKYTREGKTKLFNHSIAAYRPCRLRHMSAWAATIDWLSWEYDVLFFQSAGNLPDNSKAVPFRMGILDHLESGHTYPGYLTRDSSRIPCPSESLQALTVGSVNHESFIDGNLSSFGSAGELSSFSTTGLGVWGSIKPDVVEYGGGMVRDTSSPPMLTTPPEVCTELIRSTMYGGPLSARDDVGTSYAAPKVASIAVALQRLLPNEPSLLYRGIIVNSARWPEWAESAANKLHVLKQIGFGIPDLDRATSNNLFRVTLISSGENRIRAKEAHIYQIPLPLEVREPGDDFKIRIDVTLSYVAKPRRTRRNIRQYLSTWADWQSSKIGETVTSFKNRVLHDGDLAHIEDEDVIPWTIRERDDWGEIKNVKRNTGTVQKDWVVISSHQLPTDFCIAVVGHAGWDKDPDAYAKYALVVKFEAVNQDLEIYEKISASIDTLVPISEIEAQFELLNE
ncbi:S8 family peptidase [Nitrosospira multiformis]|uniref:S8 family peptidase n=1 Tax=Nitrosospira multiformis TaxID=1231 RepID=UPI0015E6C212|nr:S8 family peptidase [Nitrosospira multiformis]